MRARTALHVATAIGTTLLVGCSPTTADPPRSTRPATSTPTTAPTPTPTDGIQVHSDPSTGIVFEDVPALTGDEARAYDAIATYQTAFWETARTNRVSPTFATLASSDIQATMARIASNNAADGVVIGGEFRTRISDVVVTGDTATGLKCDDLRQAKFTTADGTFTAEQAQQDVQQLNRLNLQRRADGTWFVEELVGEGTC